MTPNDWRQSASLTFEVLAERLGVNGANPARTVQRWFDGDREPPTRIVAAFEEMSGGNVTATDWPTVSKTLGARLRNARESQNLRQGHIAEALGVSRAAVSQWEIGQNFPSTENLIRFATLVGTSVADLLTDGDNSAPTRLITDPERLRDRIEDRLLEVGKTARGAARGADLSDTALRNIMEGKSRSPRYDTLARLAEALQVEPDWFFFEGIEPAPPARSTATGISAASLDQREIDVRRAEQPHTIEIRQSDAVIRVLDFFVDDLVAALRRARCA